MLDSRGHGKSSAPDHGYSYETMSQEMAGAITELGLERAVNSAGQSTRLYVDGNDLYQIPGSKRYRVRCAYSA